MQLTSPPTELFNQHTCAALNSLFLALCTTFIPNSFFKKKGGGRDFTALESKWRRNAIIQDVPALSRFTAADVKAKFNIPELTQPELPSQMSSDPPPPQVDKWMNASKRSNLCEKLHLYKLERRGGAEETKQTFSQTAGLSRDEKGGPGL